MRQLEHDIVLLLSRGKRRGRAELSIDTRDLHTREEKKSEKGAHSTNRLVLLPEGPLEVEDVDTHASVLGLHLDGGELQKRPDVLSRVEFVGVA
jgi:hypothetical protein